MDFINYSVNRKRVALAVMYHIPVMPEETLRVLAVKPDGVYVDGTLGGGGHAGLIVDRLTTGRLIGIDRDAEAVAYVRTVVDRSPDRFTVIQGDFCHIPAILSGLSVTAADGVLLDLGVSSHQLDTPARGFSYMSDARPDMRMDTRGGSDAYDVVNGYTEQKMTEIFFRYGEERYARRIARAIIQARAESPIQSTLRLADIIIRAVPAQARRDHTGHPAKRAFQAIRIEVNDELNRLDTAVRDIIALLKPGGRICVITFHSLEDRIVKHCFKTSADPCVCPRDIPVCVCGARPQVRVITRKPVVPGETELAENPRARSAKLRAAEKI